MLKINSKNNIHIVKNIKINVKEKGITLVALVITIIILLILAGVTVNTALSNNGLFKMARKGAEEYQIASEKESIEENILLYQINDATNSTEKEKLGIPLHNRTSINDSQWTVVQLLDDKKQVYGDNYSYLPKGTNIEGYGDTKYNWIIDYGAGKAINIGEDKKDFVKMSWNSGLSVTDSIVLNINPINMADESSWGEGVEFCNANKSNSDVSGSNGTEIKFDGVDDYLELKNVKIEEVEGFTFEFYGKSYDTNFYPLEKTVTDVNDERYDKLFASCFRTSLSDSAFEACFSNYDSKSDKRVDDDGVKHWLKFEEVKKDKDYNYISMTVNYNDDTVTIFSKGKEVVKTTCDHTYLVGITLFDSTIPFTIGLYVGGNVPPSHEYSKFDLYACRLYTRVLSNTEIENNFNETTSYHNYLKNS